MIQLTVLLWGMVVAFAVMGYTRGWDKEIIATSGIILALFALFQFNSTLDTLLANVAADYRLVVRAGLFSAVVFFAYQDRAIINKEIVDRRTARRSDDGRSLLQSNVLGAIVGGINGYLVWGSLWYFMHVTDYPLSPYITRPAPGTASADFIDSLPLFILAGGPGGEGTVLAVLVIVLFLIVLIVI